MRYESNPFGPRTLSYASSIKTRNYHTKRTILFTDTCLSKGEILKLPR